MRKSIWTVLFTALVALVAVSCAKETDLTDVKNKIDELDQRVTALEKAVEKINKETVPGFENLVKALNEKLTVVSVIEGTDGVTITFSDGTTSKITNGKDGKDGADGKDGENGKDGEDGKDGADGKNGENGKDAQAPEINITLIDGVYYWTVNGELLKDGDGNPIPVSTPGPQGDKGDKGDKGDQGEKGITPLFGTSSEGKVIVSYDNGETWKPLGFSVIDGSAFTSAYIDDNKSTDDYIVLVVGETEVQIPKEKNFSLVIKYEGDLSAVGANAGDNIAIEYEVEGASETDKVTVDVLSASAGITATIQKVDALHGYILIGVPAADPAADPAKVSGKIFVFADNNKGKTNIKVISLEEGEISAVADVSAQVPAAGGEIPLTVTTNKEYNVNISDGAVSWLHVVDTKATHVDELTIVADPNTSGSYRVGVVSINDRNSGELIAEYTVLQQPASDVATDLGSIRSLADDTAVAGQKAIVLASSTHGALVGDANGGYIFLAIEDNTAVRGDEVSFAGVKKTAEATEVKYVETSSITVTASAQEVPDLTVTPLRYHYNSNSLNSGVSGLLQKEGDVYYVNVAEYALYYPNVIIETPLGLDLEPLVGKYVTVKGYTNGSYVDYDDNDEFTADSFVDFLAVSAAELTFEANPNWTLSYSNADGKDIVTNTVAGGSDYWFNYGLSVYSAEDAAEYESLEALVRYECFSISEMTQYWFYAYKETIDDDATTSTESVSVGNLKYGQYVTVAVGLNEDGTPSGKYAVLQFEKVDPAVPLTYDDFIGTWYISGSAVVISQKEAGVSYNIDNFPGISTARNGNTTLVANFNSEKGLLEIPDQVLGEYDDPSTNNYGPLKDYFIGWYIDGNYYRYNITESNFGVAAKLVGMPGGTLEMRAGANADGSFEYSGYCMRWIIQTGANAGLGNFFSGTSRVTLPISGIEKDKTVAGAYDDFIGDWEMEGVNGIVSIAAKEAGTSYLISGLTGFDGANYPAVEALFQNGAMILKEQELLDYNNTNYGACKRILNGVFTYSGNNYGYFWFNSEEYNDEPQVIFTANLQSDGSVKLIPGSCPYGVFVGFRYGWVIVNEESQYYRNGNSLATMALPSSLAPYVAETDNSPVVAASYDDFIGNWNVGDVVLTIAADEAGSTYAISGLPKYQSYAPVKAVFDNGSFYVMEQDQGTWDYDESTEAQDAVSGFVGANPIYPFEGLEKAKIFTAYLKESGNIVTEMGTNGTYTYDGIGYTWSIITPSSQYYQMGNSEEPLYLKDVVIKPASSSAPVAPKNASSKKVSANRISDRPVSQRANMPQPATWTLSSAELFEGKISQKGFRK